MELFGLYEITGKDSIEIAHHEKEIMTKIDRSVYPVSVMDFGNIFLYLLFRLQKSVLIILLRIIYIIIALQILYGVKIVLAI